MVNSWGCYHILIIRYAIQNTLRNLSMTWSLNSGDVKAIQVHYLVPRRDKVMDKFRLRVRTSIHLGKGPELGVRTEDEIDTRAGPLDLARLAIAPFEHVLGIRNRLPLGAHVEQVHEEVVGQRLRPLGKDAVLGPSEVGLQYAHAADENRHLRRGQRQQLRLVYQQFLGRYRVLALEVVAKAIRDRFKRSKGDNVGLVLRGIHASRREENLHVNTRLLRGLLDARTTG